MKRKIIICDDDELILEAVALALANDDHEVMTVSNSRQAMAMVEEKDPDLLIVDLQMPWVAGDDLVRELKRSDKYNKIKVIMMSASPKGKDSAERCGADAFLPKPFGLVELEYLVDKLKPPGFY